MLLSSKPLFSPRTKTQKMKAIKGKDHLPRSVVTHAGFLSELVIFLFFTVSSPFPRLWLHCLTWVVTVTPKVDLVCGQCH